jgi:hypothetical protein
VCIFSQQRLLKRTLRISFSRCVVLFLSNVSWKGRCVFFSATAWSPDPQLKTIFLTPPPGVFHQRLEPQKPTSFSIFTFHRCMISRPAAENYFFNAKYAKRNPFLSNVSWKGRCEFLSAAAWSPDPQLKTIFSTQSTLRGTLFPATSLENVAFSFPPLRGLVSQQRLLKRTLRISFSRCMISRPAAENYFFNAKYAKRNPFPSNVFLNRFRRCVVSWPAAKKRRSTSKDVSGKEACAW